MFVPTDDMANRAERERKRAWYFFGGTFVALILSGIWSVAVGTASMGGDESELVQGWSGVLRNLPGYALLIAVASLGVWFALQANLHGTQLGRSVLIATSLVLLFALSSVTRDGAEVVMTTRAATVSWIFFLIDALVVGVIYFGARRMIRQREHRFSGQ